MPKMTLRQIKDQAPDTGNGPTAYYSIDCCWWTTYKEDISHCVPANAEPLGILESLVAGLDILTPSTDCCPHCHSPLLEKPLGQFLEMACTLPDWHGAGGLETLAMAHSRNANYCAKKWSDYIPT